MVACPKEVLTGSILPAQLAITYSGTPIIMLSSICMSLLAFMASTQAVAIPLHHRATPKSYAAVTHERLVRTKHMLEGVRIADQEYITFYYGSEGKSWQKDVSDSSTQSCFAPE